MTAFPFVQLLSACKGTAVFFCRRDSVFVERIRKSVPKFRPLFHIRPGAEEPAELRGFVNHEVPLGIPGSAFLRQGGQSNECCPQRGSHADGMHHAMNSSGYIALKHGINDLHCRYRFQRLLLD